MKRMIIIAVVAMLVVSVNGAYAMKDSGDRGSGHDGGLRGVGNVNSFDSHRSGLGRGMVANDVSPNRVKGGHKRVGIPTELPGGWTNDPVVPPVPDTGLLSGPGGSTNPPAGLSASVPTNSVPEPSALLLLLLSGIGLAGVRRKLKK